MHIGVIAAGGLIQAVQLLDDDTAPVPPRDPLVGQLAVQLDAYFAHRPGGFTLPLADSGTEFQRRVWRYLRGIPHGTTRTYADVARALGSSARAVGNACRRNPIPLLVPCHRVVGSRGPGGFMGDTGGGRLNIKQWLLAHERSA